MNSIAVSMSDLQGHSQVLDFFLIKTQYLSNKDTLEASKAVMQTWSNAYVEEDLSKCRSRSFVLVS